MNETPLTGSASSTPTKPVPGICERFESAWKSKERPCLEEYLAQLPEPDRIKMLGELLALEMHYRRQWGETIVLDEYLRRFPADTELVKAIFLQAGLPARLRSEGQESSQITADTGPYKPRQDETEIPVSLGRYRITARLGSGAFGIVYKGYDEELRREVAIKVPQRYRVASPEDTERYMTEARILASLDHPGIVPVYDVGHTDDGLCHVVSKLIAGSDLKNRLKQGRPSLAEAANLVACVAEALHHAHQRGLVHRDIKPANILLDTRGNPVVADFGLAVHEEDFGKEANLAGTPQYMSPEQARGEHRVDARTDVFSLGVVFYELLTGQLPFRANRLTQLLEQIRILEPLPPSQQNDQVPADLDRICLKAMAKCASSRYPTALELARDLRQWLMASGQGSGVGQKNAFSSATTDDWPLTIGHVPPDSWGAGRPSSGIDQLKISVSRMPVTSRHLFGRDDTLNLLDSFWSNPKVNVVTLVAWGGVGKTALMNAWLRRLAEKQYWGAQCVYAWSFYSQGTKDRAGAGDLFILSALAWFGDPDPQVGTAWQKGERLARLIKGQRTLLLLDGLEPLQFPPGPQEGRIKDQAVQALLRELAASNPGLCMVSSRLPLTDLEEFEGTSARPIELEHVRPEAGASLLKVLGVKGDDEELQRASADFGGHCLALTLLGSYLTDAFAGDVLQRQAVGPLEQDVRWGGHAWRVMKSYENWFVGQPEIQLLRMLGLFDRPATAEALADLKAPPAIPDLTDSLTRLGRVEWARVISRLRRARLLSQPDPKKPDSLDTHPLVREYFGEQLRRQFPLAWREGNNRLYMHFTTQARELPSSVEEMEPLFQAIVFGCNAGRETDALHDIYFARIMRGQEMYAANKLGALGPLLSVLSHFFNGGDWSQPVEPNPPEHQGLSRPDQRAILIHAGMFHTAAKSFAARDVGVLFSKARELSQDDAERFPALRALWIHNLALADINKGQQLAAELEDVARRLDKSSYLVEAKMSQGLTNYYAGNFQIAASHLGAAIATYDMNEHRTSSRITGVDPGVAAYAYQALTQWALGQPDDACQTGDRSIALADHIGHPFSKSVAMSVVVQIAQFLRDPELTHLRAQELIDFSNQQGSLLFLSHGHFLKAWARFEAARIGITLPGDHEGTAAAEMQVATKAMEKANEEHIRTESRLHRTIFLVMLAEALGAVGRAEEGLALLHDCQRLIDIQGDRRWQAELFRVQGDLEVAGSGQSAWKSYEKAIWIAQGQYAKALQLRAITSYSRLLAQEGEKQRARQLLEGILGSFTQGHTTRDFTEAKALRDTL